MTKVSRIAILCIPFLLLLLLIIQFDMPHHEHFLSLVSIFPSLRKSHPDIILSDPGGPLLVSMAELIMLPPPVLPQLTCLPPPLPRLETIPSKSNLQVCPVTLIVPAPLASLVNVLPPHAP